MHDVKHDCPTIPPYYHKRTPLPIVFAYAAVEAQSVYPRGHVPGELCNGYKPKDRCKTHGD